MTDAINTIGVVGAGTMGQGIAQIAALAGYQVQLFDTVSGATANALIKIKNNLQKGIENGKLSRQEMSEALDKINIENKLNEIYNQGA